MSITFLSWTTFIKTQHYNYPLGFFSFYTFCFVLTTKQTDISAPIIQKLKEARYLRCTIQALLVYFTSETYKKLALSIRPVLFICAHFNLFQDSQVGVMNLINANHQLSTKL